MTSNLRLTPSNGNLNTTQPRPSAPSAPGVHDTLRSNLSLSQPSSLKSSSDYTSTQQPTSSHPLESRLANWRATQDALKMEGLRRTYGIAEPVRRGMEMKIVEGTEWRPRVMGGEKAGGVHADVLRGRDCEVDWEDVFTGDEGREVPDFHTEMEARMKLNW
ncbi:UMP1-domain-containing protein [Viridothelium virens]|uniref:UMP1-domain-containing protein n=1 Tax=Viridothelium virens TaxID=1048519 RepID=A0A6A6HQ53_VIRVR|nr:UMP1-domain-containing protein [Viridothelium virens]